VLVHSQHTGALVGGVAGIVNAVHHVRQSLTLYPDTDASAGAITIKAGIPEL
jgi:hypothetical protein